MRLYELTRTINESFDNPYRYRGRWQEEEVERDEEDEDADAVQPGERVAALQTMKFTTDDGIEYMWYAKQSRYEPSAFEVAFGIVKGTDYKDATQLDIEKTGTGNQQRVFATVLLILNEFIEFFEYDIQYISFTADKTAGENRSNLYKKMLQRHMPDGFNLSDVREDSGETSFTISRR